MGIRIQPREIEIPEDDPFKNDLLGRKESVEVITHLMGSIEGPCVLAVDAPWGTGKTTFLNIWAQHLRNSGFPVVKFNAWESDFSEDPLVAIAAELTDGLQQYIPAKHRAKLGVLKKATSKILIATASGVIRSATHGIIDLSVITDGKEESYAEIRIAQYREAQNYIHGFKRTLQDIAETLHGSRAGLPLILVIDELDRCRPSIYAVELLEVAKHLFSVDKIVFVMAINRSELAHSIKVVYGSDFDAEGYLRRFFDIDFRLPEPERETFIRAMLDAVQLKNYFNRTIDPLAREEMELMQNLLLRFLSTSEFSLRKIAQTIHRLGLVLGSLASNQKSFIAMTTLAVILRTFDAELYRQFIRYEITDADVVDKVLGRFGAGTYPGAFTDKRMDAVFAASVIVAAMAETYDDREISSPLLKRYRVIVDTDPSSPDGGYASDVIRMVEHNASRFHPDMRVAFKYAVERLELLSPGLISERPASDNSP